MSKPRSHLRPAVSLTHEDVHQLRALSADLERELLRDYENFVFRDARRVDQKRWKPVKAQDDVHFFCERRAHRRLVASGALHRSPSSMSFSSSSSSSSSERFSLDIGPQAALAANCKMPMLFGTGTINGTLDEALYGSMVHDTRSLRTRVSYAHETIQESAVVAIVDGPTEDEPFQFLGLIWYLKVYPMPGLINSREILMLGSIHESRMSNGERVGIALYHSVEHRDAPVRRDLSILRADFSFASVYRQIDSQRLEVFVTSFVEAKGSTPEAFVLQDATKSMLSVTNVCEVSFRRKLLHRMVEAQRARSPLTENEDSGCCALCDKKTSGLFTSSGSICQICKRRVCSKCSITKEIVIESTRTNHMSKDFDFCLACSLDTKDVPALTVAREELHERVLRGEYISSVSSASSGSFV